MLVFRGFSLIFVAFVGFSSPGPSLEEAMVWLGSGLGVGKPIKQTKPTKPNKKSTKIQPRPTTPTKIN